RRRPASPTLFPYTTLFRSLVRFARCCNPLPGDQIVGFITRGRGLTVHARDCLTVAKSVLDRERLIDVEWDVAEPAKRPEDALGEDRKSTRLNSSHVSISYA